MADRLRALIVDDESAARTRLSMLCAALPTLAVVGTASDGHEALEVLARAPIDLLFLDIEMPGMNGMALARELCDRPDAPAIVFVTAFDRFAVAAFGVNAAGYLLKPVDPDLLALNVSRIAIGPRALAVAPPPPPPDDFWIPDRAKLVRVRAGEIEWIGAEGDYVRLHIAGQSYLLSERLHALESRLDPTRFRRVHRSAIVQLNRVVRLTHAGAGAWTLKLKSGETIPIGRTHLSPLRQALGAI